jgi:hypothetical protein
MVESVFIGELLANLSDHNITKKDKESLIYLGAIMALFDVIIDDVKLNRKAINELFENTFSQIKKTNQSEVTAIEKVFYLYHEKLIKTIRKDHWIEITKYLSIIQFQLQSDQQLKESTTEKDVIGITRGKGGVAVLICSVFLEQTSDSFKKAMFELGAFIQMMNDCQDLYKDTVEGIRTFVHFRKNFREIFDKLAEQRKIAFQELKSLSCSYRGRSETLFYFNAMFIVISYKLEKYAETCRYNLDFKSIAKMKKEDFRINPFSPRSVANCSLKIIRFEYETSGEIPHFKFDS